MGFIDETAKLLGINEQTGTNTYLYLSPSKGVVIEGYKKIYELSFERIVLLLVDGKRLEISGKNLEIKEIALSEISIIGEINNVNII